MNDKNKTTKSADQVFRSGKAGVSLQFLCEWCKTPFESLKGKMIDDDGKTVGVGYCPKCKTVTWSDPANNEAC